MHSKIQRAAPPVRQANVRGSCWMRYGEYRPLDRDGDPALGREASGTWCWRAAGGSSLQRPRHPLRNTSVRFRHRRHSRATRAARGGPATGRPKQRHVLANPTARPREKVDPCRRRQPPLQPGEQLPGAENGKSTSQLPFLEPPKEPRVPNLTARRPRPNRRSRTGSAALPRAGPYRTATPAAAAAPAGTPSASRENGGTAPAPRRRREPGA